MNFGSLPEYGVLLFSALTAAIAYGSMKTVIRVTSSTVGEHSKRLDAHERRLSGHDIDIALSQERIHALQKSKAYRNPA